MRKRKLFATLAMSALVIGCITACGDDKASEAVVSDAAPGQEESTPESSNADESSTDISEDSSVEESSSEESSEASEEEAKLVTGHSDIPETGYTKVEIQEGLPINVLSEITNWRLEDEGFEYVDVVYRFENDSDEILAYSGTVQVGDCEAQEFETPLLLPHSAEYVLYNLSVPGEMVDSVKENRVITIKFDRMLTMDEESGGFWNGYVCAGSKLTASVSDPEDGIYTVNISSTLDVDVYRVSVIFADVNEDGTYNGFMWNDLGWLTNQDNVVNTADQSQLDGSLEVIMVGAIIKEDIDAIMTDTSAADNDTGNEASIADESDTGE